MSEDFGPLLRWYPSEWRARYGEEMEALLEDTYGAASSVPRRARFELTRSGLAERARVVGLLESGLDPSDLRRDGSLLVLVGWALFAVAGACFGKFSDNWYAGTPAGTGRAFSAAAYGTLFVAELTGCALVLLAASTCLPSLVRLVRDGGWRSVRGPVVRATSAVAVGGVALGAVTVWAHRLNAGQRNGALWYYSLALFAFSLLGGVVVVVCTTSAWSVVRRLPLSAELTARLARVAQLVCLLMVVVVAALVGWWVCEALHAPGVLASGITAGVPVLPGDAPPMMLAAGLLMCAGLSVAGTGVARIARSVSRPPSTS